jgi:hypothetical protein
LTGWPANEIAFAARLRKRPQAIGVSGRSGRGGGRTLSHKQRQQCAFRAVK